MSSTSSPGHGSVHSTRSVIHHAELRANLLADHDETEDQDEPKPFRRWVSTLRRRKKSATPSVTPRNERWTLDDFEMGPLPPLSLHAKSDSTNSSIGFVAGVNSATATLASASIAPLSRRASKWRRTHNRSSIISGSDHRPSIDTQRSVLDEAGKLRSRKRREKLEELIRTEESYVADLKALSNAYFTLLGHHHPTSTLRFARPSAQKTIAKILSLHDELLGALYRVVPFAEYDQHLARGSQHVPSRKPIHTRWHSVDIVPGHTSLISPKRGALVKAVRQTRRSLNLSRSEDGESMVLRCAPQIVAAVSEVFKTYMPQFQVYADYGANYELIARDIEETQHTIAAWSEFDRAIEALSATVNPVRTREENHKKALSVKDLLIKPIQRLPRYELLFNDLCKLTPVCDDLEAHALIQDLLVQLNDTCHSMNRAKDNPIRTRMLKTTWLLGDRLNFSDQVPRSVFLQLLGSVELCGCLHIAYRGRGCIKGKYVVCVLFETTLLLAVVDDENENYAVLAGVPLGSATLQEADNGKGLQCHTAPHSWKLVFEHSARMYELIITACSIVEAQVWREHLCRRIETQTAAVAQGLSNVFELQSPLLSDTRSIGKAFGKPGSFVKRMSVHRTATVGPTTDLNQVIIKNTQAVKEALDTSSSNASASSLHIPRSQSVATPSHVQTLAPRRADRARLEALLSDVWTKHLLPFPGMTIGRSEQIRGSANHVIRKFSMASITSNFSSSKRSASYTSIAGSHCGKEDFPPLPHSRHPPSSTSGSSSASNSNINISMSKSKYFSSSRSHHHTSMKPPPARLPLSDLLPADFDLQDKFPSRHGGGKRSALRAFTMTMERPFSPLLASTGTSSANRPCSVASLRRTQSVTSAVPVQSEAGSSENTVLAGSLQSGGDGDGETKEQVVEEQKQAKKLTRRGFLRFLGH